MADKKQKVKIHWSFYKIPGFKIAKNGNGYVPDKDESDNDSAKQRKLCEIPKIIHGKGRIQAQ